MYRVLIADDEPWTIFGLKKLVNWEKYGFVVTEEAHDGLEALRLIRSGRADVVFSDIRMPGIDGMGLIEKVKEEALPVKVVLISGYGEFEYAKKAIVYGVFGYLLKKVKKEDLEDVLIRLQEALEEEKIAARNKSAWEAMTEQQKKLIPKEERENKKPSEKYSTIIENTLQYLEEHYQEPNLSLARVAQQMYVGSSHLSKLFHQEVGCTFVEYVNRIRIDKVKELLIYSHLSITEIALKTGYKDCGYLGRLFRKYEGCSMRTYRDKKYEEN